MMSESQDRTPEGVTGESPIHVHLPSHSYSFAVQEFSIKGTVAELKHAISEQCPGRPKPHGQRIIVQGRVMGDDESLPMIEPRTVHLAVHPSAWTETPPPSPRRTAINLPSIPTGSIPNAPIASAPPSSEPPLPLSLQLSSLPTEFITYLHANALRVLSGQAAVPWNGPSELTHARRVARTVIKYAGLGWAPALEEDLPPDVDVGKGLQYTSVVIDNLPYLALSSPEATPTPIQLAALRILTYTFPLLPLLKHLPRPSPAPPRRPAASPAGQLVRRFGINVRVHRGGAARGGDAANNVEDENPNAFFPPVPEFRFQFQFHLPPSRVLLQMLFTLSRAALFIYFFAPARQPLWIACIVGWLGWEMYVVFRHTGREREAREAGARGNGAGQGGEVQAVVGGRQGENGNGANGVPANAGANAAPVIVPPAGNAPNIMAAGSVAEMTRIFDRLASINLAGESTALNRAIRPPTHPPSAAAAAAAEGPAAAVGTPPVRVPIAAAPEPAAAEDPAAVEPSLVHRVTTFLALFFITLVPAIWDRRRTRFRERETWVREMFHAGRVDPHAPAPAEGAPPLPTGMEEGRRRRAELAGWRKAYVERVIDGDLWEDGEF